MARSIVVDDVEGVGTVVEIRDLCQQGAIHIIIDAEHQRIRIVVPEQFRRPDGRIHRRRPLQEDPLIAGSRLQIQRLGGIDWSSYLRL